MEHVERGEAAETEKVGVDQARMYWKPWKSLSPALSKEKVVTVQSAGRESLVALARVVLVTWGSRSL